MRTLGTTLLHVRSCACGALRGSRTRRLRVPYLGLHSLPRYGWPMPAVVLLVNVFCPLHVSLTSSNKMSSGATFQQCNNVRNAQLVCLAYAASESDGLYELDGSRCAVMARFCLRHAMTRQQGAPRGCSAVACAPRSSPCPWRLSSAELPDTCLAALPPKAQRAGANGPAQRAACAAAMAHA